MIFREGLTNKLVYLSPQRRRFRTPTQEETTNCSKNDTPKSLELNSSGTLGTHNDAPHFHDKEHANENSAYQKASADPER